MILSVLFDKIKGKTLTEIENILTVEEWDFLVDNGVQIGETVEQKKVAEELVRSDRPTDLTYSRKNKISADEARNKIVRAFAKILKKKSICEGEVFATENYADMIFNAREGDKLVGYHVSIKKHNYGKTPWIFEGLKTLKISNKELKLKQITKTKNEGE